MQSRVTSDQRLALKSTHLVIYNDFELVLEKAKVQLSAVGGQGTLTGRSESFLIAESFCFPHRDTFVRRRRG